MIEKSNNENPDCILIYGDKALALDIKRLSNNFTSLVYDEIHIVPKEALLAKTLIAVQKITSKLKEEHSHFGNNVPTKLQKKLLAAKEKELKRKLTIEEQDQLFFETENKASLTVQEKKLKASLVKEFRELQEKLEKNPSDALVDAYNELILQNLTFFDRLYIRITVLTTVNCDDFNVPPDIIAEHQKNYDNPENITKVKQLLETQEKNMEHKTLTYTNKTVIRGLIEYVKNPDDK